jgi:glycosidase
VRIDSRDNSRTPIPWEAGAGAGFSSGTPWLPLAEAHLRYHATGAMADPASIFNAYKLLLGLRRRVKSLIYGDFTSLAESGDVLAYRRGAWEGAPAVNVVLNWSSSPQQWPIAPPNGAPLFTNYGKPDAGALRPWETVIFPEPQC